jgi:DNA-binding transcriptional LysR family regulator
MAFLHSFAVGDFLDSLVSLFAAFVLGGLIGDHLGVQLIRATRSVRLTPIGASFAAEIRDVLEHVVAATSAATGQASGTVSVSTIDSFAARWLMPRLSRFRRVHGDIDVRVARSERLADFVSDGIDIAIRCGGGQYPGQRWYVTVTWALISLSNGSLNLDEPESLKEIPQSQVRDKL